MCVNCSGLPDVFLGIALPLPDGPSVSQSIGRPHGLFSRYMTCDSMRRGAGAAATVQYCAEQTKNPLMSRVFGKERFDTVLHANGGNKSEGGKKEETLSKEDGGRDSTRAYIYAITKKYFFYRNVVKSVPKQHEILRCRAPATHVLLELFSERAQQGKDK